MHETETREILMFRRVHISSLDGQRNESRMTEIDEDEVTNGDGVSSRDELPQDNRNSDTAQDLHGRGEDGDPPVDGNQTVQSESEIPISMEMTEGVLEDLLELADTEFDWNFREEPQIGLRDPVDYIAPPNTQLPPVLPIVVPKLELVIIGDAFWVCCGGLGQHCASRGTWLTALHDECSECNHFRCHHCRSATPRIND